MAGVRVLTRQSSLDVFAGGSCWRANSTVLLVNVFGRADETELHILLDVILRRVFVCVEVPHVIVNLIPHTSIGSCLEDFGLTTLNKLRQLSIWVTDRTVCTNEQMLGICTLSECSLNLTAQTLHHRIHQALRDDRTDTFVVLLEDLDGLVVC